MGARDEDQNTYFLLYHSITYPETFFLKDLTSRVSPIMFQTAYRIWSLVFSSDEPYSVDFSIPVDLLRSFVPS